jgi:hypothetical protein
MSLCHHLFHPLSISLSRKQQQAIPLSSLSMSRRKTSMSVDSKSCQVICYFAWTFSRKPSRNGWDDKWDELWIWRRLSCSLCLWASKHVCCYSHRRKHRMMMMMIYGLVFWGMIKIQIQLFLDLLLGCFLGWVTQDDKLHRPLYSNKKSDIYIESKNR